VLIYPHHPELGRPGVQKEFLIRGSGLTPVRVRIATVDLSKLQAVPGQLREAFSLETVAVAV
jgi:hypothetical protein